jgi:glycosyltransferase involved in cell wall biosynthesis
VRKIQKILWGKTLIIGVDGTCLQGVRRGVGWYLTHLLEELSHVLEEDKVYVWMNNPTDEERSRVSENRFVSVSVTHYPSAALRLTWNTLGTPTMESLIGRPADVNFYPNYLAVPQRQGKRALFVHDLTYLTHPALASPEILKALGPHLERQAEKADLVLTCSDYNRNEMIRRFPNVRQDRIRVVPHGVPDAFRAPVSAEKKEGALRKWALDRPFFLSVGTLEPRKNLLRLVHAFLLFKQRVEGSHELVLAGPKGWIGEEFMKFIQSPQLSDKVRWLDSVPQEDLPSLYAASQAFLFPSLQEGFGMPLLEAMACGAPVLCSRNGSLPEVAGDSAWMMDPADVAEWSRAMERVVSEPAFGQLLREKGRVRAGLFRMDSTAKQTLAALKLAARAHDR